MVFLNYQSFLSISISFVMLLKILLNLLKYAKIDNVDNGGKTESYTVTNKNTFKRI